jgi:hypothetical protein
MLLLLRWAFKGNPTFLNNVRGIAARGVGGGVGSVRNSSQYYKPKQQKEAFFDVEGVVTKDTLLFRYEDVNSVRRKNLVAMAMLPLWAYLGNNIGFTIVCCL